jgi:hypothetical protein
MALPKGARQNVNFTAQASGGFPPHIYEWLTFGEDGPWIPRMSDVYGYWPLDEPSGTRAKLFGSAVSADLSESGGAVASAAGKFGLAVSSTEATTSKLLGTITPVDLSGGFTFAIRFHWPAFASNTPKSMFSLATGGIVTAPLLDVARYYGSNYLDCWISTAAGASNLPLPRLGPFAIGTWHLLVLWYDHVAGTFSGQVDGGTILSAPVAPAVGALLTALDTLNLTGAFNGNFVNFDGRLDAPILWPVTLTENERRILWDGHSETQNPTYAYKAAGAYVAQCRAIDTFGNSALETIDVPITAYVAPPVASYDRSPAGDIHAPRVVDFTDTSTGSPTSWLWDFGDGGTSILQNPSHNYTGAPDTLTITLTVTGPGGSDVATGTIVISGV